MTPQKPQTAGQGGWRIGHQGRDQMFYEERHKAVWQRIMISGEMLTGPAHHAIYFASPERWLEYPEWARHRRDEIISRVKSQFRPPDYLYEGGADPVQRPETGGTKPAAAQPAVAGARRNAPAVSRSIGGKFTGPVLLVLMLLLGVAGAMGWLAGKGLSGGETVLPGKFGSGRRSVSRQEEPVTFWISIGIYSVAGIGTLAMAAWLMRETVKPRWPGAR